MEAKDTVIQSTYDETEYLDTLEIAQLQGTREAQAEISFKAGMEYGNKEAYECGVYNGHADGLAKGIKEVVDWIRSYSDIEIHINVHHEEEWQSKLKEWGIEKG